MKNLCKNCKHWKNLAHNGNFGICESKKFETLPLKVVGQIPVQTPDTNVVLASVNDIIFTTGQNFGCVHFEERQHGQEKETEVQGNKASQ